MLNRSLAALHRTTWHLARLFLCAAAIALPATATATLNIQLTSIVKVSGSDLELPKRLTNKVPSLFTDSTKKMSINAADCLLYTGATDPRVTVGWTWTDALTLAPASNSSYRVRIQPVGASCSTADLTAPTPDSGCLEVAKSDTLNLTSGKQTFTLNLSTLLGSTKCNSGVETTAELFVVIQYNAASGGIGTGSSQTTDQASLPITIDLAPPKPPTIEQWSGGHTNVKVTWKHADENTKNAKVYWSPLPFDKSAPSLAAEESAVLTTTSFKISGLENDTPYWVAVVALDDSENESSAAEVVEVRAVPVQDLWQYYKANGGSSEGGYDGACSAANPNPRAGGGGGWLAIVLLMFAAMVLLGSRRRPLSPVARRTVGLLMVALAAAWMGAPSEALATSPRTASLDLRVGYYKPAIDTEFADAQSSATPYKDVMVDSAMVKGLTVDWLVFDGFGELSLGFGAGWWEKEGTGKSYDGGKTDDKTTMQVLPLTLDLSYRFTVLAEKFNFPLVPYGRVGLGYAFWWINNGVDETATYTNSNGDELAAQGGVAGLHGSAGLRLLLDVFEPQAAKGFDMELGVNHSYLFVEFQRMSLNNFGRDKKVLDLSDDVIQFGLAFDL